jgi:hypothetical protein
VYYLVHMVVDLMAAAVEVVVMLLVVEVEVK